MWPNSRIAVMGGEQAAGVLATVWHATNRPTNAPTTKRKDSKYLPTSTSQDAHLPIVE